MSHENRQYEKSFQGVKNKTDGKKSSITVHALVIAVIAKLY